jgi:signal peptidase II
MAGAGAGEVSDGRRKLAMFGTILGVVVVLDLITKLIVQRTFRPLEQIDVIGSFVRLTYITNPGAAFGIYLGPSSRLIFLGLSVLAIFVLVAMYRYTPAGDRIRLTAIALICSGAFGNLIDRLRSTHGVIDFVDVGIGDLRWPVFNVADMAVTTGAVVLALSLWREDRRIESRE